MPLSITAQDELTHEVMKEDVFRESFYFDVIDHESGLGLLGYFAASPHSRGGLGFVHVADREKILYSYYDYSLVSGEHEAGKSQLSVGPFTQTVHEPLARQTFSLATEACTFDLEFSSTGPCYDYHWPWTRSRHYEQFGSATATIVRPGAAPLTIAGSSLRDHAWGVRGLRPWRGWYWITSRTADGSASWSVCWTGEDREDIYGFYVDENQVAHELRSIRAEFSYGPGDVPTGTKLRMRFDEVGEVEAELQLFGVLNLSDQDPHKKGGYFFSFFDGVSNGTPCMGTFDIYAREGIEPWSVIEA